MKRTKRKLGAWQALAVVNSMPVQKTKSEPYDGRTGLRKFTEEYEAEQREKQEVPLRAMKNEHVRVLQQLIEQDSPTLYSAPSTYLEVNAPSSGDASQFNGIDPQEIRARIRKAFSTFEGQIVNEGQLTASGKQKLQRLAVVNTNIDWTSEAAWYQGFLLLYHAGELTDQGDSESPDFVVREQAEPEVSPLEQMEQLDLSTRDGAAQARVLADQDYFGREGATMFAQWEAHILRDYNVTLNDTQKKAVIAWLMKWNKNPLHHECWNEARRALGKAGIIPLMLSQDEKLAESLESVNLNDFAARRRYAAESRLILGR